MSQVPPRYVAYCVDDIAAMLELVRPTSLAERRLVKQIADRTNAALIHLEQQTQAGESETPDKQPAPPTSPAPNAESNPESFTPRPPFQPIEPNAPEMRRNGNHSNKEKSP